jgi:hypothetical protein
MGSEASLVEGEALGHMTREINHQVDHFLEALFAGPSQWWPSVRAGKESFEKMIDLMINFPRHMSKSLPLGSRGIVLV